MSVIYPAHCRGTTAGNLRQLKQHHYSVGSNPLFDRDYIFRTFFSSKSCADYFDKREPCGEFMEALERTKHLIEDNTEAVRKSAHRLVDMAREANKDMADVTGKMRDGMDKLSAAIVKMQKSINTQDLEKTVKLTDTLASALERLAALEERGLLDKIMRSMRGGV